MTLFLFGSRSKQGLEEWRNQAKLKQLQSQYQNAHPVVADTAPYATQITTKLPEISQTFDDATSLQYKLGSGLDHHKVEKYKSRLEEKRKQVGLITHPSSELQEAEKCLAEVRHLEVL